jgi:hypothetical protein
MGGGLPRFNELGIFLDFLMGVPGFILFMKLYM